MAFTTEYNRSVTHEQRVERGKKAAATRRRTQSWRESARLVLEGTLEGEEAQQVRDTLHLPPDVDLTQREAILAAGTALAKQGNKDWAAFLRDTAGEHPQVQLKVGNLEKEPFRLDLASMSDRELRAMADGS